MTLPEETADQRALRARLEGAGFAFARAAETRAWLTRDRAQALSDWERFAAAWDGMPRDEYMKDGARDRRRRHAVLSAGPGETEARLEPRQPHYQSTDYNPLHGGIQRWFQPIDPGLIAGPTCSAVLAFGCALFGRLRPGAAWKIELHQFRIEAAPGLPGRPTPEGVHRDGVDGVIVLLVRRENVASGTTTVHDLAGAPLGQFTLTEPLDAALVDDARVKHGVTPVVPLDPARPSFRDVLVATWARRGPDVEKP